MLVDFHTHSNQSDGALPPEELDGAVDAFCQKLLQGSTNAIRWTKVLLNLELKRIANTVLDAGIAYEAITVRSADHRDGTAEADVGANDRAGLDDDRSTHQHRRAQDGAGRDRRGRAGRARACALAGG